MSRSYGGKRLHEGTDLMPPKNQRDTFAVVSVCDGVVEKNRMAGIRRLPHWNPQ